MISGTLDLRYVNDTGEELDLLHFRLYPNGDEYAEGGLNLEIVAIDGEPIDLQTSVADTVATIALPGSLADGEMLDIAITFVTTVPTDPVGSYGMFAFDSPTGNYALAHWLPLLAGYDPVTGWLLDPLSEYGDPVFTNAALFDVAITAPDHLVFVTTGSEIEATPAGDGLVRRQFISGPVRDFVMAVGDDFEVMSVEVGETTVNSFHEPGDEHGGELVLTAAAQSLAIFNDYFGAYPYEEMDLVQIDLGNGAGGVEFPQLMFIGGDYYGSPTTPEIIPRLLEFIVAHEVAHQWWYAMVGNNQYRHAFTDEGLTNFCTVLYFTEQYGEEVGRQQANYNLRASYFNVLFNAGDEIVDQPTDDFPSGQYYGSIVYGKAGLGFEAIDREIGRDAFLAALQSYARDFRFEVATPDDLLAAFETASGQELDELWTHWFEEANGREDFDSADLARLLRELRD
jgi:hypothetical protein